MPPLCQAHAKPSSWLATSERLERPERPERPSRPGPPTPRKRRRLPPVRRLHDEGATYEPQREAEFYDHRRGRLGVNYKQIPVNAPTAPVHSYSKDGVGRIVNAGDPVYAPSSYGGSTANLPSADEAGLWAADGEMTRQAYILRADDDDFGQAHTLVRHVFDDNARERLVNNVVGTLLNGVVEPVLGRVFEYWRAIDADVALRIEQVHRESSTARG